MAPKALKSETGMKSFLVSYLWVTGAGALAVIAAPWLVVYGLMAFIVPGILLAALPTAFLYGAIFWLVWYPIHGIMGDWPAAAVAALATAVVVYAIPIPGNWVTEARYKAELADDRLPAKPIRLVGHIRLNDVTRRYRKEVDRIYAADISPLKRPEFLDEKCTELCAALLFQPGVESVTINSDQTGKIEGLAPRAVTYVLAKRNGNSCESLKINKFNGPFFYFNRDNSILHDQLKYYWKERLKNDLCLMRIPTRHTYDWNIVTSTLVSPLPKEDTWREVSFLPRSVEVNRLEVFDRRGIVALRHSGVRALRMFQPILYLPQDFPSISFRWKTSFIESEPLDSFSIVPLLQRYAGLDLTVE
jgi:hypothetical protein